MSFPFLHLQFPIQIYFLSSFTFFSFPWCLKILLLLLSVVLELICIFLHISGHLSFTCLPNSPNMLITLFLIPLFITFISSNVNLHFYVRFHHIDYLLISIFKEIDTLILHLPLLPTSFLFLSSVLLFLFFAVASVDSVQSES